MWLFTITYTFPLILFEYISDLSGNHTIYLVCVNIYNVLYSVPGFVILYSIHNSKLSELLEIKYKSYHNPSHIYLTLLYLLIYVICLLITYICSPVYPIIYMADIFSYSIFLNEIAYTFLDNSVYHYTNKIDFYNNNIFIFILYGAIINRIIYLFPPQYFLQGSFLTISIIQNAFINLKYNPPIYTARQTPIYTRHNYYNIIYPFERLLNILLTVGSSLILFILRSRSIYNFPV